MDKLISIVIPIYNSEKYISRMLDSILKQSFDLKKVEIICVNDNSTDNSLAILEKYRKTYPNLFNIIDKDTNEGVSAARDDGYLKACGKYIVFLDNDDYIDSNYLEVLFEEIENGQLDMVMSGRRLVDEENNILSIISYPETFGPNYEWSYIWGGIHRASFLRENDIHYRARVADDNGFVYQEYISTKKIKFISYVGYNWVQVLSSLSHKGRYDISRTVDALLIYLETFSKVKNEECLYFVIYTSLYYFHRSSYSMKYSDVKLFDENLKLLINKIDQLYPNWKKIKVKNINKKIPLFMFTYKFVSNFRLNKLWAYSRVRSF